MSFMKQHLYLDRMIYRRWLESGGDKQDSGGSDFPDLYDENVPTISIEDMARIMG